MCTLTWISTADGYEVFFNRDENLERGPELPVASFARDGVRCLAPRDSDCGGTWMLANEYGVTLCLLNAYHASAAAPPAAWHSRGALLMSLCTARSASEVESLVAAAELERFRPFILAAFDGGAPAPLAHGWDGTCLAPLGDVEMPLVSSAVEAEEVLAWRRRHLGELAERAGGLSAEVLRTFHASHENGPGPLSTCMHRGEAATRSHARARVTAGEVSFTHHQGPPCAEARRTRRSLARRVPAAGAR